MFEFSKRFLKADHRLIGFAEDDLIIENVKLEDPE